MGYDLEAAREQSWEKILRINTTGRDDSQADSYRYPYEPTPYCVLERLAQSGWIGKRNTLLDYGCGKGRVDYFLSFETRCKTIGIEYDERIYQRAVDNGKKAASANRVTIVHADAAGYTVPEQVDRVYFFNPFSVELLRSVLDKLLQSIYESPRRVYLFFYYPSDEYIGYLMTRDELEFTDEIPCDDLFSEYSSRERIVIFQAGQD